MVTSNKFTSKKILFMGFKHLGQQLWFWPKWRILDFLSCLKKKKNKICNNFQDTEHQAMEDSDPWEMNDE